MMSRAQRKATTNPRLSQTHRLEKARIQVEEAIAKYQALVTLEEEDIRYKHIPIPSTLSGEASAYVALSEILRLQSTLCLERSKRLDTSKKGQRYLSARGETSTKLYELACQNCNVAAGMAGALGNTYVEAMALQSLSNLAASRHVNDVALHRLERAIALLGTLSKKRFKENNGQIHRLYNQMNDKKLHLVNNNNKMKMILQKLKKKLGHQTVAVEENKITELFVGIIKSRMKESSKRDKSDGNNNLINYKEMKMNLDGLFEMTNKLGSAPMLNENELMECMEQIRSFKGGDDDVKITERSEFSLEEFIIWWLDSMDA
jgi:hypothetical protein